MFTNQLFSSRPHTAYIPFWLSCLLLTRAAYKALQGASSLLRWTVSFVMRPVFNIRCCCFLIVQKLLLFCRVPEQEWVLCRGGDNGLLLKSVPHCVIFTPNQLCYVKRPPVSLKTLTSASGAHCNYGGSNSTQGAGWWWWSWEVHASSFLLFLPLHPNFQLNFFFLPQLKTALPQIIVLI